MIVMIVMIVIMMMTKEFSAVMRAESSLFACLLHGVLRGWQWEHAYYLEHTYHRANFIEAWWNVVNWTKVAERYAAARNQCTLLRDGKDL